MNVLLVIRSEILGIFILFFLIVYNEVCAKYREGKDYFRGFALTALGHTVMGLVTEITVNSETVAPWVNDVLHVLFFTFALLFSLKYFEYVLSQLYLRSTMKKYVMAAYVLSLVFVVIMIISPIDYLQGKGTKYSAGTGPTLCYMLGFVLFLVADVFLLANSKKISKQVLLTLLPLSFLALGLMAVQIVVPEFLFTGGALTMVSVAAFFTIENPIGKFRDRALIDQDTQVWNRNCYEYDRNSVIEKRLQDEKLPMIYVLGDINGLKEINDTYGHLEGDRYIAECAAILTTVMYRAFKVYRIGGDEFAALYLDMPENTVLEDIQAVEAACAKSNLHPSISLGYALHRKGETIEETEQRADVAMYEVKDRYYADNHKERRER